MPTPSRPVLMMNKHLTNAEKKQRENAEKALITGKTIKEWPQIRANPVAHKHFRRLVSLYRAINKNDALTEPILNRYCLLQAECEDFERKREKLFKTAVKFEDLLDRIGEGCDMNELRKVTAQIDDLYKGLIAFDRQIQTKRKMLLDIERESLMTLAAQMRSIPKKPPGEEKAVSGVAAFKKRRAQ